MDEPKVVYGRDDPRFHLRSSVATGEPSDAAIDAAYQEQPTVEFGIAVMRDMLRAAYAADAVLSKREVAEALKYVLGRMNDIATSPERYDRAALLLCIGRWYGDLRRLGLTPEDAR